MRSLLARSGLALLLALLALLSGRHTLAAMPAADATPCCRGHGGGHGGSHGGARAGGSHQARGYTGAFTRSRAPRSPRPRAYMPRPRHSPRAYAPGARDSRGRLKRSAAAKDAFMRQTGHPRGWPGHVVDHVVPLACGGADDPSNMQWQTTAEARAKDRTERVGCSRSH